jgi:hypothetical protein
MEDSDIISLEYQETGHNYRYFLNWRYALLAGHVTALSAHAFAFSWLLEHSGEELLWLVFLSGLGMTFVLWGLEYRNRNLYRTCIKPERDWAAHARGRSI